MTSSTTASFSFWRMQIMAALYVLSGVCQPLLMTLCKTMGLANPQAQLYMVFYYLGPSLLFWYSLYVARNGNNNNNNNNNNQWTAPWRTRLTAMLIAAFDVLAQALNYTGNSLAGPTIFAIIYSSVTVWTAVWARLVLNRELARHQCLAIAVVFCGLALTATDTWQHRRQSSGVVMVENEEEEHDNPLLQQQQRQDMTINDDDDLAEHFQQVIRGTLLTVVGSALHAGSYVWSEAVLTGPGSLTVAQNTGVQCLTATTLLTTWQLFYTRPRWEELIAAPAAQAHTTVAAALALLGTFALVNLVHASTFFGTIKYYKGGSVMAGVFKGLQAVLVFGATHAIYCGRIGGDEMCFTRGKWISLITVVSGVVWFSAATPEKTKQQDSTPQKDATTTSSLPKQVPSEQSSLLVPLASSGNANESQSFRQQYTL